MNKTFDFTDCTYTTCNAPATEGDIKKAIEDMLKLPPPPLYHAILLDVNENPVGALGLYLTQERLYEAAQQWCKQAQEYQERKRIALEDGTPFSNIDLYEAHKIKIIETKESPSPYASVRFRKKYTFDCGLPEDE